MRQVHFSPVGPVRQNLKIPGFRKIDPDRWEFANEGFLRGQKPLLTNINRRKSSHAHSQPHSLPQNASLPSCVGVGEYGLDEDIERLKKDKNVLMQELVRLRQQQQTTDTLLQALKNRTQGMEQHQQHMMSFLSKAMHNPGLLDQLIQQKSSNNHIPGGYKKRRLPNQREFERESASSDGQIANYQRTLPTETTKSMLMQILTSDKSPRSNSFSMPESIGQLGNFHLPTDALGINRFSSTRSSGNSFQTVPLSAGMPNIPSSSGSSAVCSSRVSEIQTSLNMTDTCKNFPSVAPREISQAAIGFQEYALVQSIKADKCFADIPSMGYLTSKAESTVVIPLAGLDDMIRGELENFSGDAEIDIFKASEDMKFSGVVDSFWEQFISADPLLGAIKDVRSSIPEVNEIPKVQVKTWDSAQNRENLN